MFGFRRKKKDEADQSVTPGGEQQEIPSLESPSSSEENAQSPSPKVPWLQRLKTGLSRTRHNLADGLANIFLGKKNIDSELFEQIEEQLLLADVGTETTNLIIKNLTQSVSRQELRDPESLFQALKQQLSEILTRSDKHLTIDSSKKPFVILVVGVNGNGKTTTIGKLAKYYQNQGKSVMMAAGDTFRAAAIEQLQVWGDRNDIPVIAQQLGADSASVIFDAMQAAKARNIDVLLADTAGRLHTKQNLMEELKKIKRVAQKNDDTAPHETLLVLDGGTGQNALQQAQQFHQAIGIDGLAITKLDGTAKGGMLFAISQHMALPIHFIGVGEGIDDLRPFVADEFVEALFSDHQTMGNGNE